MAAIISIINKGYSTQLLCMSYLNVSQRGQHMKDETRGVLFSFLFFTLQNDLGAIS